MTLDAKFLIHVNTLKEVSGLIKWKLSQLIHVTVFFFSRRCKIKTHPALQNHTTTAVCYSSVPEMGRVTKKNKHNTKCILYWIGK